MNSEKRVTIKDVARESGYSVATIHCALNGKPGVGDAARQQIGVDPVQFGCIMVHWFCYFKGTDRTSWKDLAAILRSNACCSGNRYLLTGIYHDNYKYDYASYGRLRETYKKGYFTKVEWPFFPLPFLYNNK